MSQEWAGSHKEFKDYVKIKFDVIYFYLLFKWRNSSDTNAFANRLCKYEYICVMRIFYFFF